MRRTSLVLVGVAALAAAGPAAAEGGLGEAVASGKPILEVRARYEGVDQQGFADSAGVLSLRLRAGWETGSWMGLKALVEIEDVHAAGDHYDGVPPAAPYPTVSDPEVTELNRAQLAWTPGPWGTVTVGRQRIVLDDQRFVGNSGWRQDEQTFDAVRGDFKAGKLAVTAAWLDRVNRTLGESQDWGSDSWLLNARYEVSDRLKPSVFVYALDLKDAPASSTLTAGARVTGKSPAGPVTLAYAAAAARQQDYGANTGDFELDYLEADLAATYRKVTLRGAYERLEGDGARGFSTPLGTLHAFQGWADAFVATPADGIEDRNLSLVVKPAKLELTARYHDFQAQRGGRSLGGEVDLQATAPVTKQVTAFAKYADYDGVPGYADRRKLWIGVEFKL